MFPDMSSLSFSLFSASAISLMFHVSPSDYACVLQMWISVKKLSLSYRPVFPQGLLNNSKRMTCFIFKLSLFHNECIFLFYSASHFIIPLPPPSAYNARDPGSIPGFGRSPGEGNGNPLRHSCLENPMG